MFSSMQSMQENRGGSVPRSLGEGGRSGRIDKARATLLGASQGTMFSSMQSMQENLVEEWPSGQWQQTVNLSSSEFAGSNPASSTNY